MSLTFPRLLGALAGLWVVRSVLWGPVAWVSRESWLGATVLIALGAAWLLTARRSHWGAGVLVVGCIGEIMARPFVDDEPALLLAWLAAIVLLTGGAPTERAFLLRVNTTTIYVFAAASKVNPSWLAGEGVLGVGVVRDVLGPAVAAAVPLVAILVEASLALGLWFRRTRAATAVIGIVFHAAIVVTISTSFADVLFLTVLNFGLVAAYTAYWHPIGRTDLARLSSTPSSAAASPPLESG